MAIHLFIQKFRDGIPVPMPYPEVIDTLQRHGHAARPPVGDLEIAFPARDIAERAYLVGDLQMGGLCVAFYRPTFSDDLRRLFFELMARFDAAVFDDALDHIYVSGSATALPATLVAAAGAGVQCISDPQQLWPAESAQGTEEVRIRPVLRYTNRTGHTPNILGFDHLESSTEPHRLNLTFLTHGAACNEGILRALRNTLLKVDDALSDNPGIPATLHFRDPEAYLLLQTSPSLSGTRAIIRYMVWGPATSMEMPEAAAENQGQAGNANAASHEYAERQLHFVKPLMPQDESHAWGQLRHLLEYKELPARNLWERLFKSKRAAGYQAPNPVFTSFLRHLFAAVPARYEVPEDLGGEVLTLWGPESCLDFAIATARREFGLTVFDQYAKAVYRPEQQ